MALNLFNTYEFYSSNLTTRLNLYGRILDAIGFFIFVFFLWKNNLVYAISTRVLTRILSFLASVIFASKTNRLTKKEEEQKTVYLFVTTLTALLLYYGIWYHSYKIIFASINIFLLLYLFRWMKIAYSNV